MSSMMEGELDNITAEIGGMKEFQSLLVRVHLKETADLPEGHMPSSSYIANNVLTLYTDSSMRMPLFLIPPPMIRFIEVMHQSGNWGVRLISWTQKIQAVKNLREAVKATTNTVIGLKEAKELIESTPVQLIEGIERNSAEKYMKIITGDSLAVCTLTFNGIDQ